MRAREERAASRITTISTTTTVENLPAASPTAFDPETGTLEELEQTSQRLQRDWPKEDGIPFPPDMLETLRALRAAVIARDARKRPTTAETPEQPTSAELVEAAAETASKKAEKATSPQKTCHSAHHSLTYCYHKPTRHCYYCFEPANYC